jgi:putative endonuclease
MDEFVVYILYSSNYDKIYIGFTTSIIQRFYSHNVYDKKGSTYKYRPWHVIHIEFHASKSESLKREKELKGRKGREWIRKILLPELKAAGFISA